MIKVSVSQDEVKMCGHSDYEEIGKDIVCSAASSIMITTVNAILKIKPSSINYYRHEDTKNVSNDYSLIRIVEHDDIVDKLIENMIDLLKDLSKKYPKDINVKER